MQESKKCQRFCTLLPEFSWTPAGLAIHLVLCVTFKLQEAMHKAVFHLDDHSVLKEQRQHYRVLFLVTPSKRVAAREITFQQELAGATVCPRAGFLLCLPLDDMIEAQFRLQGPL